MKNSILHYTPVIAALTASRQARFPCLDCAFSSRIFGPMKTTSHTYNCEVAEGIVRDTVTRFHPAFVALEVRFAALLNPVQGQ